MNEISVLASNTHADTGTAHPPSAFSGIGGYELFGLGWRPATTASEYVGRHRSTDA
jgi:hypothetical protein